MGPGAPAEGSVDDTGLMGFPFHIKALKLEMDRTSRHYKQEDLKRKNSFLAFNNHWGVWRGFLTFELSGPRGWRTMTKRGALASSRVMLFSRFTSRSGRGVATGFGPSLRMQIGGDCSQTSRPLDKPYVMKS